MRSIKQKRHLPHVKTAIVITHDEQRRVGRKDQSTTATKVKVNVCGKQLQRHWIPLSDAVPISRASDELTHVWREDNSLNTGGMRDGLRHKFVDAVALLSGDGPAVRARR